MNKKKKQNIDEENIAEKEEAKKNQEETEENCENSEEKDTKADAQEEKYNELNDRYLRLMAEYDNYKKRSIKERTQAYDNAKIDAINELLPVLDNLDRAVSVEVSGDEAKKILDGVLMVKKQLIDTFTKIGVKPIEAVGQTFNPELHNAVMHIEDEAYGENEIVEEFAKGYTLNDKVIRHSMVKVAN